MENARLDDLACAVDFHVRSGTVLVDKKKISASACNLLFFSLLAVFWTLLLSFRSFRCFLYFLFSLCSLRSLKIRMKAIGNNRNVSPEYPTNHSVESHLQLTEITWKITETKTLM